MADIGTKAVFVGRNKREAVNQSMSKPIDEIEKAWEKWVYAKTKGLVKGDFPYAEQLLEYRKAQARILHRELIHLVPDKKGQRWPDRRKRRKSKMQK